MPTIKISQLPEMTELTDEMYIPVVDTSGVVNATKKVNGSVFSTYIDTKFATDENITTLNANVTAANAAISSITTSLNDFDAGEY